jgi:acid phosphatase class B
MAMDELLYSYDEVVAILESGKSDVQYFLEEKKHVHVCFAYDKKIKWAWGSQSFFKEVEYFSEQQKNYMLNAKFKKEYSNII